MAEVFLARRSGPAGFTRDVALKCALTGLDLDDSTRRAFVYEARLASRLRHPNIAEAYELAVLEGRYYLVLEYVDGVTAKKALEAARSAGRGLSETLVCHVVASIAEGLHHAHALCGDDGQPLGIVHRDVKASNVMIARSGAVKLLDFGVAFARLEGRDRTRTGHPPGTYAYFSPEQASGEPVDRRSDLFSLGILLVELLTGKRVFDARSEVGTLRRAAECRPEDIAGATAGLPPDLAAISRKALAKEPAGRFQDGAEFSRALREYLGARGVSYWPSDCAAELRELERELLGAAPALRQTAEEDERWSTPGAEKSEGAPGSPASAPLRAKRPWTMAAVAAGILGVVAFGVERLVGARQHPPAAPLQASPGAPTPQPRPQAGPGKSQVAQPTLVPIPVAPPAAPLRREKRTATRVARVSPPVETPVPEDRPSLRPRKPERVDRPAVENPVATLPRGTLVSARLLTPLDVRRPGVASAELAEEVVAQGMPPVPKGSTLTCTARPPREGRVPLSCDRIAAGDRVLSFSGVAVGEGQHVGLRAADNEVAAGTPFVVYVNAPDLVR